MDMQSVPAEAASHMLQSLIITAEQTYVEMKEQWMAHKPSSAAAVQYVEAVGALVAGTSVWSASCPRYNMHRSLGAAS